jgi:hypothetical protein
MLAALQSRLELSIPSAEAGALLALRWHGSIGGAHGHEDLAAAHMAASHRVADLEGAVAHLEVGPAC